MLFLSVSQHKRNKNSVEEDLGENSYMNVISMNGLDEKRKEYWLPSPLVVSWSIKSYCISTIHNLKYEFCGFFWLTREEEKEDESSICKMFCLQAFKLLFGFWKQRRYLSKMTNAYCLSIFFICCLYSLFYLLSDNMSCFIHELMTYLWRSSQSFTISSTG